MTDRELLELAAKAAGWTWWRSKHGYWNLTSPEGESLSACHGWAEFDQFTGEKLATPSPADALSECGFCPLTDDGDALRLAVKLRLDVEWLDSETVFVESAEHVANGDPYAATRRAIVRAAAEIGKAL